MSLVALGVVEETHIQETNGVPYTGWYDVLGRYMCGGLELTTELLSIPKFQKVRNN